MAGRTVMYYALEENAQKKTIPPMGRGFLANDGLRGLTGVAALWQAPIRDTPSKMQQAEYTCTLSEVGEKRAREELGEIPTDRLAAVAALREWVLAQNSWLQSPTDTQFLLAFLRHRKFSQKAAKERLIKFWKSRSEYPEWFLHMDTCSEVMTKHILNGVCLPLPKLDRDGSRVYLVRSGRIVSEPDFIKNYIRLLTAMHDWLLMEDMTQVCGIKVFQDMTGVTSELVMRFADGRLKKFLESFMKAYPLRIMFNDYYNVGALFDLLFSVIRLFTPKKIQERTEVHKSLKTLYAKIDISILPREYLPDDYDGPPALTIPEMIDGFQRTMQSAPIRAHVLKLSSGDYGCDDTKAPDDAIATETFRSLKI